MIQMGMSGQLVSKITESDIAEFARLTGDRNPVHMDEDFAKRTQFGGRIAHGSYSACLISACIGMKMPGPGAIYLGQNLRFNLPVHFGDVLVTKVQVINIEQKKNFKVVDLQTDVINQNGEVVTSGVATVMPAKKEI
ncbi:MaoC family dehydratase [Oenococcus sp. UCMA 16435]|nr:MaoC family dehydratase [Oenococcus sp. UCMA 16435]